MSMRFMSLPPSRLPSGLASFGRTTSAICDCDSLTARGGTMWMGVSRPSFEFILSFSHEGCGYRVVAGKFADATNRLFAFCAWIRRRIYGVICVLLGLTGPPLKIYLYVAFG